MQLLRVGTTRARPRRGACREDRGRHRRPSLRGLRGHRADGSSHRRPGSGGGPLPRASLCGGWGRRGPRALEGTRFRRVGRLRGVLGQRRAARRRADHVPDRIDGRARGGGFPHGDLRQPCAAGGDRRNARCPAEHPEHGPGIERRGPCGLARGGLRAGGRSRAPGERAALPLHGKQRAPRRDHRCGVRAAADAAHQGTAEGDARGEGTHHPRTASDGARPLRHPRRRRGPRLPEGAGHGTGGSLRRQ